RNKPHGAGYIPIESTMLERVIAMGRSKKIRLQLNLEALEDRQLLSLTMGDVSQALTHSTEHYTRYVTDAYEQFLGRSPDTAGLAGWVDQLQNHGLSDERLQAFFI